ncbi:MAG: dephospho-CoA kinase [Bacteroidota bacterium]
MIIGLTGGIGSGKTTVAKLFETMGCVLYNSDEAAKLAYYNPKVKQQVIELLGENAYINFHEIDRNYISKQVFSNKSLLEKLNAIIHPAVKENFIQFQKTYASAMILKESALLFETNIYKDLDKIILVTAPLETKIARIKKRNTFSDEEINKRIKAQWADEQKIPLADFIVLNDGSKPLIPQVIDIIQKLKQYA